MQLLQVSLVHWFVAVQRTSTKAAYFQLLSSHRTISLPSILCVQHKGGGLTAGQAGGCLSYYAAISNHTPCFRMFVNTGKAIPFTTKICGESLYRQLMASVFVRVVKNTLAFILRKRGNTHKTHRRSRREEQPTVRAVAKEPQPSSTRI